MNWKNQKGYTGIDIAISVVVLFIGITLIATLSYTVNITAKEIEWKSMATEIAVEEIETIKNTITLENINTLPTDTKETSKTGFFKTIEVQDYADINTNKIRGVVKKVTVKIQYKFKKQEQTIALSTIISKES
ncbi:MAG: hypothetical protein HFJ33_04085 [Clostridia bacterium]|nr:hypothetical protein [Clostridia bacterium]